jgi:heme/copper-type cytochrome/quinol oxidase subunit 3
MGLMGMYLFVLSLGMLFGASVVAYLVLRSENQPWPPPGFPTLPRSLWLSTAIILLCSIAIHGAMAAVRRDDQPALRRGLLYTLLLGLVFLGSQTYAWAQIVHQLNVANLLASQYVKLFYLLSGLHAVHVLGGLISLGIITRRARAGIYGPENHVGVSCSAIYWHFLDAVWCVLFVVLYW